MSEKIDWSQFLPKKPLPKTGFKKFVVGQVWATFIPGHGPTVRRVTKKEPGNEYATFETLAGEDTHIDTVAETSTSAEHSQLVKDANETILQAEVFVPQWARVVERVMEKAREHLDAGRANDFVQVFVPIADYHALKDHFQNEPILWTAIGPVSVHPVNPDGATFSD